jgi:hypothetical protein
MSEVKQLRNDSKFLIQLFSAIATERIGDQEFSVDSHVPRFSKAEISTLVRKNGILRRSVYDYPQSAAAAWIKLNFSGETNKNPEDVLTYAMKIPFYTHAKPSIEGYGMRSAFKYASGLARKFGSAHIVLGIADGQDISEPINYKRIKSIDWMKVYDCYQLTYKQSTGLDFDLPGNNSKINQDSYGLPNTLIDVHPDRVLTFYGNFLDTREEFYESTFNHDSVVISLFDEFIKWSVGNKAVAKLLTKATAFKFGMQDLGELVKSDIDTETTKNQDYLRNRASSINKGLSVADILWYDKEFEDLDTVSLNLAGVKDSIDTLKDSFAAVSDMPRWKLFNESNSGGGLSTSIQAAQVLRYSWAFSVTDWSYNNWLNPLYKAFSICISTRDLYGSMIDNFSESSIEFPLNVKMSPLEQMELEKLAAERTKLLIEQGSLTPEEVRSQYASSIFNPAITLDALGWQKLQKDKELARKLLEDGRGQNKANSEDGLKGNHNEESLDSSDASENDNHLQNLKSVKT